MKKKLFTPRVLAEVALLSALAIVLDLLQSAMCRFLPFWPNGGSFGIAMVPIFILAYRRGTICGLLGGFLVGLLDILDGVDVSPLANNWGLVLTSVMLDYILAWTVVGLAGLTGKFLRNAKNSAQIWIYSSLGILIGGGARFICHFLSGLFLWEAGTEILHITVNIPHYLYSLLYNGSYIFPCILICILVCGLLINSQPREMIGNEIINKAEVAQ